jgi:hypothetical protein
MTSVGLWKVTEMSKLIENKQTWVDFFLTMLSFAKQLCGSEFKAG